MQDKIDNARKVAAAMRELTAGFVTNNSKNSAQGLVACPEEESDNIDEPEAVGSSAAEGSYAAEGSSAATCSSAASDSSAGVLKDLNNTNSTMDEANDENCNTSNLPPQTTTYQTAREKNMSRKENVILRQVGLGSKSHDLNEFSISEEALIFEVFAGIILRKSFEPCSSKTIQSKLSEFAAGKRVLEKFGTK